MESVCRSCLWSLLLIAQLALPARAIDLLPFDYVPAPAGTSALLGYYIHGTRDSLHLDGTGNVANSGLDSHVFAARLTHWEVFGDTPVAAQLILPFGSLEDGRIGGGRLNAPSGLFDPTLTLAFWPVSDPDNGRWLAVANPLDGQGLASYALTQEGTLYVSQTPLGLTPGCTIPDSAQPLED